MVTGEIRPSGSKTMEVHFRILRFVANIENIAASYLGEANIVSEWVSHHKPKTLTGLVSSNILCVCAMSSSCLLLDAQSIN